MIDTSIFRKTGLDVWLGSLGQDGAEPENQSSKSDFEKSFDLFSEEFPKSKQAFEGENEVQKEIFEAACKFFYEQGREDSLAEAKHTVDLALNRINEGE